MVVWALHDLDRINRCQSLISSRRTPVQNHVTQCTDCCLLRSDRFARKTLAAQRSCGTRENRVDCDAAGGFQCEEREFHGWHLGARRMGCSEESAVDSARLAQFPAQGRSPDQGISCFSAAAACVQLQGRRQRSRQCERECLLAAVVGNATRK